MKIAVWLNHDMLPEEGGAFTFTQSLIKMLDEENFAVDIVFIAYKNFGTRLRLNKKTIFLNEHFTPTVYLYKLLRRVFKNSVALEKILSRKINKATEQLIYKFGIDCIYYPNQTEREISVVPFIATNWDLGHLLLNDYPEFKEDGQDEKRRQWYSDEIHEAKLIAVESEAGKNEVTQLLKIPAEKICVVPLFATNNAQNNLNESTIKETLDKYRLVKEKYLYYPAQYWKHKNHATLVEAFKKFSGEHADYKLVFSGADKGELIHIKNQIAELKLEEKILCLGFISSGEKNILLQNCLCLAMPTLLGPTNLPPLEAMEYGILTICSDLAGHREMMGEGALYFNPYSAQEMEEAMEKIIQTPLRSALIEKLQKQKANSKFSYGGAKKGLTELFVKAKIFFDRSNQ